MKVTTKYVMLTAVKNRKVYDLLFLDANNARSCIELAKADGFKTVGTKHGSKAVDVDILDLTGENVRAEFAAVMRPHLLFNDETSHLEPTGWSDDEKGDVNDA